MSKDIWHKPIETTDVDNNLIIDDWTNGTYELGYFDDKDMIFRNFRNDDTYYEESMMRWCDVDELIDDYNRTRKALEIAIDGLKSADEYYMYCAKKKTLQNNAGLVAFGMDNTITKALDEITALKQKKDEDDKANM